MTTIALTTSEIGSDLQYTEGNRKWKGGPKVFFCEKHPLTYPICDFYLGLCGKASELLQVADFFRHPEQIKLPKKLSGVSGAILTVEGDIFCFDDPNVWIKVLEPYYAIGSGCEYALGALAQGSTVKQAIQLASKFDVRSGLGTKVFSIM